MPSFPKPERPKDTPSAVRILLLVALFAASCAVGLWLDFKYTVWKVNKINAEQTNQPLESND